MVVLNVGFLLLINWWAYCSCNIETEYHESQYIAIMVCAISLALTGDFKVSFTNQWNQYDGICATSLVHGHSNLDCHMG
jgi:hypothetical protein